MTASTTTRTTTTAGPADERITAVPEHLWTIEDLARFLQRCANTARKVAARDDAPIPVFSDGKGQLWDPRAWWGWADERSTKGLTLVPRKNERTKPTHRAEGRQTRV